MMNFIAIVTIKSGATLTLPPAFTTNAGVSNRVWIVCTNFVLNTGGRIFADGRGYASQYGPGKGVNGSQSSGGAGYGGKGGNGSGAAGGGSYGSTNEPLGPGSGGGYDDWTGYQGGSGGGAVRIEVAATATIDGTISANGTNASGSAGSGGSIYINCFSLGGSTSGLVQVNGGTCAGSYGGGGGGRIAVAFTNTSGTVGVRFGAAAGTGYISDKISPNSAQMGTVYLSTTNALTDVWKDQIQGAYLSVPGFTRWSSGDVTVSNAFIGLPDGFAITATNIVVATPNNGIFLGTNSVVTCSNLNLRAGARMKMLTNAVVTCGQTMSIGSNAAVVLLQNSRLTCGGDLLLDKGSLSMDTNPVLNCVGNMTLTNGASVTIYSGATNGLSPSYGAMVCVGITLTVASNCWVYPVSDSANGGSVFLRVGTLAIMGGGGINADGRGYASQYGLGKGVNGSQSSGGAGYGGKGGNGSGAAGGNTYGSTNAPLAPGSGGGYDTWTTYQGGYGGGLVRIEATGGVKIDGMLSANGTNASGSAGSGGAIFVTCQSFRGSASGKLQANGGRCVGTYGGGGGGRIAVWYEMPAERISGIIDGSNMRHVIITNSYSNFSGTLSVTNGGGYTNLPPGGAEPGTIVFLTVTRLGSVISLR